MTFSTFVIFCLTSSTSAKCFLLRNFFYPGKQKKSFRVRLGELGGWGKRVMPFLVKNCITLSTVWAGVLVNQPLWNGQMHWKSLQKNSLKSNAASHNTTTWYTDTDGFLKYSSKEGSLYYKVPFLQKMIPVFFLGGAPLVYERYMIQL